MPPRKTYTPEQKAQALALYEEHGPGETARRVKIPESTIASWAGNAGLRSDGAAKTMAATEAARVKRDAQREELRTSLLAKALDLVGRLDEPMVDYKGNNARLVQYDRPPAADCKNYATAAAVLIDKFRLEMGEVTDRAEHRGLDVKIEAHTLIQQLLGTIE